MEPSPKNPHWSCLSLAKENQSWLTVLNVCCLLWRDGLIKEHYTCVPKHYLKLAAVQLSTHMYSDAQSRSVATNKIRKDPTTFALPWLFSNTLFKWKLKPSDNVATMCCPRVVLDQEMNLVNLTWNNQKKKRQTPPTLSAKCRLRSTEANISSVCIWPIAPSSSSASPAWHKHNINRCQDYTCEQSIRLMYLCRTLISIC